VACVNLAQGGLRLRNSLAMLGSNHLTLLHPKKLGDRRRVRRNSSATFCSGNEMTTPLRRRATRVQIVIAEGSLGLLAYTDM
jgi:hypothetical protein